MKKVLFIVGLICLSNVVVRAQTEYNLTGLGRAIITNDRLSGDILEGDNSSPNQGVGGYILFDAGNHLGVGQNFQADFILRVRSPFGAFWGVGTSFEFRQFQISGNIKDKVEFQLGDIYLNTISPYLITSFDTEYSDFESALFRNRREILWYENFVQDNTWRMQGAHIRSTIDVNKVIDGVELYGFAVRTNSANEVDVADRIFAGARVAAVKGDWLKLGVNYAGLQDIPIEDALITYQNNVISGFAEVALDKENYLLKINAESGVSSFDYEKDSLNTSVSYNDYFIDGGVSFNYKPSKLVLGVSYRNVGQNFTSPGAQTRRINVNTTPALFPKVVNETVDRNQTLYDRYTDETLYRRSLSPVLQPFLPQYNNITPYGQATPNRSGLTVTLATDTSLKVVRAEVKTDLLSEVIGEGIEDKRQYLGVYGGTEVFIGKIVGFEKMLSVSLGAGYQSTTRSGLAPLDFNSLLLDAGLQLEFVKDIDLLIGVKMLNANGNEFLSTRDEFNQLATIANTDIDVQEMILGVGGRIRIDEGSYLILSYNKSFYEDKLAPTMSYNMSQFFVNFTLSL